MKSRLFTLLALIASFTLIAQNDQEVAEKLPYFQIPEYSEAYTAETVAARMIDGLGFRFYWATEGLREEDLAYRPNEEARTSGETIDHILGLSNVIVNAVLQAPNIRGGSEEEPVMTFAEQREKILNNLKTASDRLRTGMVELEDCKLVFQSPEKTSEYPFWNNINGPIADALWHCGQVVSFRRSSGNPFNSKVSVFNGKLRD